jgi:hypothetical protein
MIRIGSTISVGIVLSVAVLAGVPAPAADTAVNVSRHGGAGKAPRQTLVAAQKTLVAAQKSEAPQRTCDWVGPGGRAIYRCR